jgi:drug/metabolite transporter (DMT)-like permease
MEKGKELYMYILGGVLVTGFLVVIGLMIFRAIPDANEKLLYMLLGVLAGMSGSVVNYFYGSSKSSADKTDLLLSKSAVDKEKT